MHNQQIYTCTTPAFGNRPEKSISFREPSEGEVAILLADVLSGKKTEDEYINEMLKLIYVEGDSKCIENVTLLGIVTRWAIEQKLIPAQFDYTQQTRWDTQLDDEIVHVTVVKEEGDQTFKFKKPSIDLISKVRKLSAQSSLSGLRKLIRESKLEGEVDLQKDLMMTITLAYALLDAVGNSTTELQEKKTS